MKTVLLIYSLPSKPLSKLLGVVRIQNHHYFVADTVLCTPVFAKATSRRHQVVRHLYKRFCSFIFRLTRSSLSFAAAYDVRQVWTASLRRLAGHALAAGHTVVMVANLSSTMYSLEYSKRRYYQIAFRQRRYLRSRIQSSVRGCLHNILVSPTTATIGSPKFSRKIELLIVLHHHNCTQSLEKYGEMRLPRVKQNLVVEEPTNQKYRGFGDRSTQRPVRYITSTDEHPTQSSMLERTTQ